MPIFHSNRCGILALTAACALFAVNDVLTKVVALRVPAGEVLFARTAMAAVGLGILLVCLRRTATLAPAMQPVVFLRAGLDTCTYVVSILALTHMPLAELVAITLVSPLLTTSIMALFFKEPVGWRRWTAILVGLSGTMLILKPGPGAFNAWGLVVLVGAFASAIRDIVNRRIDPGVPTLAITFMTAATATTAGALLGLGEQWNPLPFDDLYLLATAAAAVATGIYLAVSAFRDVDVSVVTPFRYTMLLWGGLGAYIMLGELPDAWSILGALLIVGSGTYTLQRDALRHRDLSTRINLS